jgi:hypothetical protein
MSKNSTKPTSVIKIGGNVNTGGGAIAGRDLNNSTINIQVTDNYEKITQSFSHIYSLINDKKDIDEFKRKEISKQVATIEKEVCKVTPSEKNIKRPLTILAKMAPDILTIVLTTIANPLMGLAKVAQKISEKASQ